MHRAKCFTFITSFNSHSNSVQVVSLFSHFADVSTESQRDSYLSKITLLIRSTAGMSDLRVHVLHYHAAMLYQVLIFEI